MQSRSKASFTPGSHQNGGNARNVCLENELKGIEKLLKRPVKQAMCLEKQRVKWLARLGLNQRPLPCQGSVFTKFFLYISKSLRSVGHLVSHRIHTFIPAF